MFELHQIFEMVHIMLKLGGNHPLILSGFVFGQGRAYKTKTSTRGLERSDVWEAFQQERLWEVSKRQQAFYSATSEGRKNKSGLTCDLSHFHLGTDHLEKQRVNVPTLINLGAILLPLNPQTDLSICRSLQWTPVRLDIKSSSYLTYHLTVYSYL